MYRKSVLICMLLTLPSVSVFATQDLSTQQIKRATKAKMLFGDADTRSLNDTLENLKKSPEPEGSLQILEAVAAVYNELNQKYQPTDNAARMRLLDKIHLNMTYFQLGGQDVERPSESDLTILIRRKLKNHLSPHFMANPRLFHSL